MHDKSQETKDKCNICFEDDFSSEGNKLQRLKICKHKCCSNCFQTLTDVRTVINDDGTEQKIWGKFCPTCRAAINSDNAPEDIVEE